MARAIRVTVLAAAAMLCATAAAQAQISQLVSPGPLSKAHASLEGVDKCRKCHEPGRRVTNDHCLSCHKPVADRIRLKAGVHRNATGDCAVCHVEHAGVDAELRPFNLKTFDHGTETGFAFDGRHLTIAKDCAKCHKTRSFLTLSPTCSTCHTDVHKPSLGSDCRACHTTAVPFKDARSRFDHSKATFQLAGAHRNVACVKCHVNQAFKGLKFAQCTDCHKSPHRHPMGDACTTCHIPDSWKTQKIDHGKTAFPLRGKHADVACVKCHTKPPLKAPLTFDRCATCHQDPHRGAFRQDCNSCHTEAAFGRTNFEHDKGTKFPLTGKHAPPLACVKCHKNATRGGPAPARVVDFRGLSTTCASCHADVHKGEVGSACETCHSPATFRLPGYRHPRIPEFFDGQHQTVPCASCHLPQPPGVMGTPRRAGVAVESWKFKNLPTSCATCHQDVHLGQVGSACEACHTIDAAKFAPVKFAHARTAFQLTGRHETIECRKCHKPETGAFPAGTGTAVRLKGLGTACSSCHKDQHLGQLGPKCETCHTTASFKLASYKHLNPKAPILTGKHATSACNACHTQEDRTYPAGRGAVVRYKVGTSCTSCHADAHRGSLGTTCDTCHTPAAWRTVSRAFHKSTVFPLEGRHLAVECASCHQGGVIKGTPSRCADCHWFRRQDDPYRTRLGIDCAKCHRPIGWTAVRFDHGAVAGIPLSAVHRTLGCDGCHKSRTFTAGSVTCFSCHAPQYQATKSPAHQAAGFPTQCEVCHRASHASWSQAVFSHSSYFALSGVHATTACASCHKNNVYRGTPRDCIGCHRTDYDRSATPNHAAAGFPTACESCHKPTDSSWKTSFDHNRIYLLVGLHATQACTACHKNNIYKGTPISCVGCHRTNYDRTTNPNHAAAGFATTCESCHRAGDSVWRGAVNHSTFALVGLHATQACTACHKNNIYKGTPRDCIGCHRTNYDRTTNPNHAAAGFPTACESCHRATDATWTATFNHAAVFPLVGLHSTQACTACHKNNVYKGTPRDCVGCHRTDYDRTTSPNHAAAGFPTACESCHRPTDSQWRGAVNHSTFTLVGLHATQACTACHKNNVYKGTPRDCVGCHLTKYQQTTNPNHAAAGFPTACDSCHQASAASWSTSFNHASIFPLVGTHATQACTACHKNNVYKGTPRTCVGCHLTRYQQTTNPNHAAAGFSTTCDSCHSASAAAWTASFNHNTFFVLAGRHLTAACSSCHKNNIYKGTPRTCYPCHQTQYDQTTNPNHRAAGFPTTCDTCHRYTDTSFNQGTFNHTWFPITSGKHVGNACSACHNDPSNFKVFTCLTCHDKARTDSKHQGRAGYRYDSAACYSCHPRGSG